MKRLLLALCLAVGACASVQRAGERYDVDGAYTVSLERPWSDVTRAVRLPKHVHLLTVHAASLERLYLVGGLEPGEALLARSRGSEHPVYRADFSRTELAAFITDSLAAMGYARIAARNVRPSLLASAEGVRMDIDMQTIDGLDISAMALAAQADGKLNLILFIAPGEHYFPMFAPEIDRMLLAAAA